jgi:hypothetical protein
MSETKTIEIDIDVHKLIEAERRSFAEAPNAVLRRLLNLGEAGSSLRPANDSPDTGAWTGKGIKLLAGTELKMEYRGREHRGLIQDAGWFVEGKNYKSPSAAAGGVARTKDGKSPSLDGWKYWQVKRPADPDWVALDALRRNASN